MEKFIIYRLVIHELKKEARKVETKLILSEALSSVDEFGKKLVIEIHKSFTSSHSLKHSNFRDTNDKLFKFWLEKYYDKTDDETFYRFSSTSLKELEVDIQKEAFATGGYYIFTHYQIENKQYITVVLLRKKDNLNLNFSGKIFTVTPTENLNIEKIAMGFRFNYQIFNNEGDSRNYIALITNQQDKLSEYFKEWVAVADIITDEQNTNNLVKVIHNIPLPEVQLGEKPYDRERFKNECFAFVNNSPNKVANLRAISAHFYGEDRDDYILNYADENSIVLDNEFKRNPKMWRKLTTVNVKVKGIELKVDYDKLNANDVDVQDKMIIIRSEEMVNMINSLVNDANEM